MLSMPPQGGRGDGATKGGRHCQLGVATHFDVPVSHSRECYAANYADGRITLCQLVFLSNQGGILLVYIKKDLEFIKILWQRLNITKLLFYFQNNYCKAYEIS